MHCYAACSTVRTGLEIAEGLVALNELSPIFEPVKDDGQNNVIEIWFSSSRCKASKNPLTACFEVQSADLSGALTSPETELPFNLVT